MNLVGAATAVVKKDPSIESRIHATLTISDECNLIMYPSRLNLVPMFVSVMPATRKMPAVLANLQINYCCDCACPTLSLLFEMVEESAYIWPAKRIHFHVVLGRSSASYDIMGYIVCDMLRSTRSTWYHRNKNKDNNNDKKNKNNNRGQEHQRGTVVAIDTRSKSTAARIHGFRLTVARRPRLM